VSVFATLPLRVVRKGHGFRDPRHRPVQQARRHLGDESVRSSAHSGRARPGPVRVEHHQRVHRRALPRLFLYNFEKELFVHVSTLEDRSAKPDEKKLANARQNIRDRLAQLAPMLLKNKYMLGEEFSMLDVAVAPLLWRLDHYGIELPKNAAPLQKYAERIFSRPAYIEALTPSEKVMRR